VGDPRRPGGVGSPAGSGAVGAPRRARRVFAAGFAAVGIPPGAGGALAVRSALLLALGRAAALPVGVAVLILVVSARETIVVAAAVFARRGRGRRRQRQTERSRRNGDPNLHELGPPPDIEQAERKGHTSPSQSSRDFGREPALGRALRRRAPGRHSRRGGARRGSALRVLKVAPPRRRGRRPQAYTHLFPLRDLLDFGFSSRKKAAPDGRRIRGQPRRYARLDAGEPVRGRVSAGDLDPRRR